MSTTTIRRALASAAVLVALTASLTASMATAGPASAVSVGDLTADKVTTANGVVQGSVSLDHREFKGIPFAAAPVGERRFAAPQPASSWSGVRKATSSAAACPQSMPFLGAQYPTSSEDCLYLDVTTPQASKAKHLPVMVWFYGGAYQLGATDQYGPAPLVTRGDVIVVSVAYRVGPFGFLALDGTSADAGLLDQQAGLKWVRQNIAAFGGDASNVTIFGESAGGNSVCQQLASPTARGLFDKAIVESGACGSNSLDATPLATARSNSTSYAAELGCSTLACLRGKSVSQLLSPKSTQFSSMKVTWKPVADGVTLLGSTGAVFAAGTQAKVPVLIGGNRDEGRLFVALFHHLATLGKVTQAQYEADVREVFGDRSDAILAQYADVKSLDEALANVWTDGLFACPGLTSTKDLAASAPAVYAYEFDSPSVPLSGLDPLADLGSFHGSELFFLFDKALALPRPPLSAAQQKLSDQMIGYWTTFARTGDPNGGGRPVWPKATSGQALQLTTTGPAPRALSAVAAEHRCGFWG